MNHKLPYIKNTVQVKNLDRFFYEYASIENIDITPFDISQDALNLELDMIYHKFFKKEILDTMFISDHKNYLVSLSTYNLKNYTIKVPEQIFSLFESTEFLSGKITLEFDKIRGFFYISNFERWDFNFTLNDYLTNENFNYKNLLKALGYNDSNLLFREKISLISRLLPCVEKNINIVEITKPQVGKSFIFDEIITKNSIVKKLNDLTPTNLFSSINSTGEKEAILKKYSVLCIDEFHKGDLREIVSGLQTFMENGKVSRGKKSYHSDTSIIMFANFKEDNFYKKIFINPKEFNPFKDILGVDRAFLQRINYINPSFGMRTLKKSMLLNDDVERIPFSLYENIFNELRKIDIDLRKRFPELKIFNNDTEVDIRITESILKITSGYLKLLFPNTLNYIKDNNIFIYNNDIHIANIFCCLYLAMEGSSFLNILQGNLASFKVRLNNNYTIQLGNLQMYKYMVSYFLEINLNKISAIYPHRVSYTDKQANIFKKPLDTIGIDENIQENSIYNKLFNSNHMYNDIMIKIENDVNNFNYIQYYYNNNLRGFLFKHISTNYLFGYNLNLTQLDTSSFGSQLLINNNILFYCPNCKNYTEIPLINIINYYGYNYTCSYCSNNVYIYDLFPEYFKDYKE